MSEELGTQLATELMHELKCSSKRWFIAFIVMCFIEVFTVVGFIWYISLPAEDTSIEQQADDDSYNQIIGGDYNFSETESIPQEKSD